MDAILFYRGPFNRLPVTFRLICKACSLFSFSCIISVPTGRNTAKTAGPAAHFTKLVYFSYGILDRQAHAVSFYRQSDNRSLSLLSLNRAGLHTLTADSHATVGRTTKGITKAYYSLYRNTGSCCRNI